MLFSVFIIFKCSTAEFKVYSLLTHQFCTILTLAIYDIFEWQEDLEMEPDLDKDDMVKPNSPIGLYGEKLLTSDYLLKKKVI